MTAVDISARRMARVGENLARAGLSADLVTADAGKWITDATFDAILLDAPCSGTGTLRRHPDIAWLKDEEDVGRLTLTQDRLLVRAADLLKPGGTLVYAVCSLQEDEGPARLEALLARDKRLARMPGRAGRAARPRRRHHAGRRRPHPALDVAGAARPRRLLHRAAAEERLASCRTAVLQARSCSSSLPGARHSSGASCADHTAHERHWSGALPAKK